MSEKLGDVAQRIAQGIRTSANEVYVLDIVSEDGDTVTAKSKILSREVELERAAVSLFLQGREIKSYQILPSGKVAIVPYNTKDGRARLIPESEYEARFPKALAYLTENRRYLEDRERGRMRGAEWYAYTRNQNIDLMLLSKVLVPDISDRASFALDERGDYAFTSGYGITLKESVAESPKYVLGLLNSKLLDYYLKQISTTLRGGFFRYFTQYIKRLPIRTIDFLHPEDADRHERMVGLVMRMLELHEQLAEAKIERERTVIGQQIAATDRPIDRLVYELYELTDEEITVVEEAALR